MNIALAQCNPKIGDIEGNLQLLETIATEASKQADLLIFSELFLTGYPPKDLLKRPSFIHNITTSLESLKKISLSMPTMGIIVGLPLPSTQSHGKALMNGAVLIDQGTILYDYHKWLLPNYDVFDEWRYFEPGTQANVITYKGMRLGITICEDVWAEEIIEQRSLYQHHPIQTYIHENVDLLINLSASPFYQEKNRTHIFQKLAKACHCHVIFVNQVGGVDELIFDGGSCVVNPTGMVDLQLPTFESSVMYWDSNNADCLSSPETTISSLSNLYQALLLGIYDYVEKSNFNRVFIGLSGGIDSAVVTALAVAALGADQVTVVVMPGPFSSEQSLVDAQALVDHLKITLIEQNICPIFDAVISSFDQQVLSGSIGLAQENIQARLRGVVLMAYANQLNGMVLTTGNKSELAVGYCTLYGDMNGALAPLGDVYKTQVYELAEWMNRHEERIPVSCLTKPPSAELRPDQTDQDTLPDYSLLDDILKRYIEDYQDIDRLLEAGFESDIVHHVIQLVERSEYKRYQSPPVLKVTPVAFGCGRRHSLVACQTI